MNDILVAVIPVVIIGIVCAAVLVVASKLMAVKEDERFPAVRDCLPGANCGACGFAGCDGYAKALCESSDTPANLCIPGGADTARQLGEVLGVTILNIDEGYTFLEAMVNSLGSGLGFFLAMVMFSGVRSKLEGTDVPKNFKGLPITLVAAAITSLSFLGFGGVIENLFA